MTDGANFITVENNTISNGGDDGIAVVSYQSDGKLCHDITARNNIVLNNKWGRNMSVVGGSNVLYENNYLEGNPQWACMYMAQESSYATYADTNITFQYNTLKNCGTNYGHGAILLYSDGAGYNDTIKIIRNDIIQSGQIGIKIYSDFNRNILLDSNRVTGANPDYAISGAGVTLIRYVSGAVGYIAPSPTPTPTPAPAPAPAPAPSYTITVSSPSAGATVAGSVQVVGTGPGLLNV